MQGGEMGPPGIIYDTQTMRRIVEIFIFGSQITEEQMMNRITRNLILITLAVIDNFVPVIRTL